MVWCIQTMNIFVLSNEPDVCAQMHCDKHVVKMVLETAQLLSTAHHIHGTWTPDMYKPTHMHHPCTKWVCESDANYWWASHLFMELCNEYTHRYGKVHKSEGLLDALYPKKAVVNDMTPFALAMPDKYKVACPVTSYRNYYLGDKAYMATWTNRNEPEWWTNETR